MKLTEIIKTIALLIGVVLIFAIPISGIGYLIYLDDKDKPVWKVTFYENGKPSKTVLTTVRFDEGFQGPAIWDVNTKRNHSLTGEYTIEREKH